MNENKTFVGQINLNNHPSDINLWEAGFCKALDRTPLFLREYDRDYYAIEYAVDDRSEGFWDAMELLENACGMSREELEDAIDRGAFDCDGELVIPKCLVDVLAEHGTEEYQRYCLEAAQSCAQMQQRALDQLNRMMDAAGIPTLNRLETLLQSITRNEIAKRIDGGTPPTDRAFVGENLWVTNGHFAELVQNENYPYHKALPVNEKVNLQSILDAFTDKYEEAELLPVIIRRGKYYKPIAVLQSKNHTVYLDERYAEMLGSFDKPFIRSELEPILVQNGDRISKIICPVRFHVPECDAKSQAFQDVLPLARELDNSAEDR